MDWKQPNMVDTEIVVAPFWKDGYGGGTRAFAHTVQEEIERHQSLGYGIRGKASVTHVVETTRRVWVIPLVEPQGDE